MLRRRDFLLTSGCGSVAFIASPLRCLSEGRNESPFGPQVLLTWGSNGHGEGQFDIPISIAVNSKDEIFVSDFRQSNADARSRIQRFDQEGHFLDSFETDPMPGGMAFDKDGLLYVTHMMKHKVAIYDSRGKVVREFGKQGSAPGEFNQPGGIAFGLDGTLYVADQANQRIQRLSPEGVPISTWGRHGSKVGEFGGKSNPRGRGGGPHFLAFDRRGDLYTTEASEGRIQKLRPDGTFILAFGDNEVGAGHFGGHSHMPGPLAITVDHNDQVWVTSTNDYVHQFSSEGRYIGRVGGDGKEPGQFQLPHGLAFDSQHHLYVADAHNSRIQKLSI
jgi:DNA-binding beta-propeller fold protein YncE